MRVQLGDSMLFYGRTNYRLATGELTASPAGCDAPATPMQDLPIQRQVRHQPLQAVVLFAQLAQLAQFLHAKPRVLLLPGLERRLAHAELPANIRRLLAALILLGRPNNLLLAVPLFRHVEPPGLVVSKTSTAINTPFSIGSTFGFWVRMVWFCPS